MSVSAFEIVLTHADAAEAADIGRRFETFAAFNEHLRQILEGPQWTSMTRVWFTVTHRKTGRSFQAKMELFPGIDTWPDALATTRGLCRWLDQQANQPGHRRSERGQTQWWLRQLQGAF